MQRAGCFDADPMFIVSCPIISSSITFHSELTFGVCHVHSLTIRLFELETGKRGIKLSGSHAGSVSMLEFSKNGQLVASAASGGRFVNVYNCVEGHESLLRTIALAGDPTALSIRSTAGASSSIATLVACCNRGALSIFQFSVDGSGSDVSSSSLDLTQQKNESGTC